MRKIKNQFGTEFEVEEHLITRNMWEYYVLRDSENTAEIKLCLVMGFETEIGSVYMPEIMPYVISKTKNLRSILPPEGCEWVA